MYDTVFLMASNLLASGKFHMKRTLAKDVGWGGHRSSVHWVSFIFWPLCLAGPSLLQLSGLCSWVDSHVRGRAFQGAPGTISERQCYLLLFVVRLQCAFLAWVTLYYWTVHQFRLQVSDGGELQCLNISACKLPYALFHVSRGILLNVVRSSQHTLMFWVFPFSSPRIKVSIAKVSENFAKYFSMA